MDTKCPAVISCLGSPNALRTCLGLSTPKPKKNSPWNLRITHYRKRKYIFHPSPFFLDSECSFFEVGKYIFDHPTSNQGPSESSGYIVLERATPVCTHYWFDQKRFTFSSSAMFPSFTQHDDRLCTLTPGVAQIQAPPEN